MASYQSPPVTLGVTRRQEQLGVRRRWQGTSGQIVMTVTGRARAALGFDRLDRAACVAPVSAEGDL
jgi:hypothetical protein